MQSLVSLRGGEAAGISVGMWMAGMAGVTPRHVLL